MSKLIRLSAGEARKQWLADAKLLARAGIITPDVRSYRADEWGHAWDEVPLDLLGLDAYLPTTPANAGIPTMLSTTLDPNAVRVIFSPPGIARILGEVRRGNWTDQTWMIPVIEHEGEVSTYGDYNENGNATSNITFPQRQAYLWQTMKRYGERELDIAGLAKVNYANEIDMAAGTVMKQFANWVYAVGVVGLQNYGILNDPALPASIGPTVKAAGNGNVWMVGNVLNTTATEAYADIQALFTQLVTQSGGVVEMDDELKLVMSPITQVGLTATNQYNVNVGALLKNNFPNITVETEVRYGVKTAANPQGNAAGALMQLIAPNIDGAGDTGMCAYTERMRSGPVIRGHSSYSQKETSGSWGTILKLPYAVATMLGV